MTKDLKPYLTVYPMRIAAMLVLIPLGLAATALDCQAGNAASEQSVHSQLAVEQSPAR